MEADSEAEALQIGEDTDGAEFISEDNTGDWSVYQAVKHSELPKEEHDEIFGKD